MKEERGKNLTKHPPSGIEPDTVHKLGECSTDRATETGLSKRQSSQLFLPLKDAEPLFPADPTAVAGSHPRRFGVWSIFSSLFFHIILHSPQSAFFIITIIIIIIILRKKTPCGIQITKRCLPQPVACTNRLNTLHKRTG